MKRIWLLIFFLPLFSEAAVRVAVIGDPQLTAEITALLSGDSGIELLERADAFLLKNELQLFTGNPAEILQADFPHAELIALVRPEGLLIFNARNGFVLLHAGTAATPETIPGQVRELLRQADAKAARTDSALLALGAIRSTGLATPDRRRAAALVTRLLRQLANSDTIQLLERDWLGAVLDERELSGLRFPLPAAARVLELEFLPGAEPETIDLILLLTDTAGNELWRRRHSAIADATAPVQALCSQLHAVPGAELSDPAMEASRLCEEYHARKRLMQLPGNYTPPAWEELRPLVQAMLALEPDNLDYQRELILYEARNIYRWDLTPEEVIRTFNRFLADVRKFYQDHPDYLLRDGKPLLAELPGLSPAQLNDPIIYATPKAERQQLYHDLRLLRQQENQQSAVCRRVTEANIETALDFSYYQMQFRDISYPDSYFSADEMMRENYAMQLKLYRVLRDLLRKSPEIGPQIDWQPIFPGNNAPLENPMERRAAARELQTILNEDSEIAALVREIDLPVVTSHYHALEAAREFLNSDHSRASLLRIVFALYEKQEQLGYVITPKGRNIFNIGFAVNLVAPSLYWQLSNSPRNYLLQKRGADGDERAVIAALYSGRISRMLPELIRYAPQLQSLAYQKTYDEDTHRMWNRVAAYLAHSAKEEPESAAAWNALNSAWDIEAVPLPGECKGATAADGRIYLLLAADTPIYNSPTTLAAFEYSDPATPLRQLPALWLAGETFRTARERYPSFSASGNYLLAGGDRVLVTFDRSSGSWNYLYGLPGNFIVSALFHNERIYYLTGGLAATLGGGTLCGMYSCRPDGSDRRIHFSGDRLYPELELDRIPQAKLSRLIPLPDGRLLFGIATYNAPLQLYTFDPETETFAKFLELPDGSDFSLRDQGDFVLGTIGIFDSRRYFRLDKHTLQPEWLPLPLPADSDSPAWQLDDPWQLGDNWLINVGFTGIQLLRTDAPEQTPLLLLPEHGFYAAESPAGWDIVTSERIFRVKLRPAGN